MFGVNCSALPAAQPEPSEIERMRTELVTEEELTLATSYLGGVFPIQYETTAAIATASLTRTIGSLRTSAPRTFTLRGLSPWTLNIRGLASAHSTFTRGSMNP